METSNSQRKQATRYQKNSSIWLPAAYFVAFNFTNDEVRGGYLVFEGRSGEIGTPSPDINLCVLTMSLHFQIFDVAQGYSSYLSRLEQLQTHYW